MWMQVPGDNRPAAWIFGTLALIWLCLSSLPAAAADEVEAATPAATPAAAETTPAEISFMGKFSCPLKRRVVLPFQATITQVQVEAGQKVKKGDVLARYSLTPEGLMTLRRRLAGPQVKELEVKLAETEKALAQADAKEREVSQLASKKLAPALALAQVQRERQVLIRQRSVVQERLKQERQIAAEDRQALEKYLGEAINNKGVSKEATLKAPITGYVLYTHPDLREGAELDPNSLVFQVGVMDPMVINAQVHEIEAHQLKVGDQAEIAPESLPGRKFLAQLSRLSWAPVKGAIDQPTYYEAEFQVPNPDLTIKEGMKVRIVIRRSK